MAFVAAGAATGEVPGPSDPPSRKEFAPMTTGRDPSLTPTDDAKPQRNFLGLRAAALTEPLVTDRPDFTESTDAVPFGRLQWEGGYTFTCDREGPTRVRDHSAPETLLRVGIVENWELRIGLNGYSWTETLNREPNERGRAVSRESWTQGANDLSFGVKVKLLEQQGWIPHFGVIAEASVPSGSAGYTSGDVDPGVKLLWAYDLSDRFALAGNVNFASLTDEAERFFEVSASISLAVELSERWGTYVEYFGFYPVDHDDRCTHYLNGGLTYLVSENFQLDARVGFGLNREADDFFTGVGFAVRF
jgi:hypothetical protein